MKQGKSVLIISPFYPPNIGGAETFAEALVKEATKKHEVRVLAFRPFGEKKSTLDQEYGAYILRLGWPFDIGNVWKGTTFKNFMAVFPKMLHRAWRINKGVRPDTIHAQGLIAGLIARIIKRKDQKLLVTLLTLYDFDGKPAIFRHVAKWIFSAGQVFVEGETGFQDVYNLLYGQLIRVKRFQHWVDLDRFTPGIKPQAYIEVLFVGRPIPQKGIKIVNGVRIKMKEKKIVFHLVENISYNKLLYFYKQSDILVAPYLHREGIPRVIIEATACGCVPIVSNVGALHEVIGIHGKCIEPTVQNFYDEIMFLEGDRENLIARQKEARRYAEKHFSARNAEIMIGEY